MKIRKTCPEDLEQVMKIYAYARKFMAEHGNPRQWGPTNWPPEERIRRDIAEGKSYVCETDHPAGVFYFDQGPGIEPTYTRIEQGSWEKDAPYGVVHRIASDGSAKGLGTFCISWALEQCGYLRIDTHPDNWVMQNLLNKLGFIRRGVIHVVEDNDPRYAFDRSADESLD